MSSEFTPQELSRIKEERGLNNEQIQTLQKMAKTYRNSISKEQLLDTFRTFGYRSSMLEADLKAKFGQTEEKPVRITYDLLPSGKIENFSVEEV